MNAAERMRNQYGVWGSHPEHSPEDWQFEVANGDTRVGYWEWVAERLN
ncbi:hypothetical protein [Rhodococcus pyridinivorans]|nr:hypothetical protein [Rhodococcus pyridinivorans]